MEQHARRWKLTGSESAAPGHTALTFAVRLSDTGMLSSRREGNNVYYRVVNGCVPPLLDLALCLMEDEGCTPTTNRG